MNREAQILQALQGDLPLAARKALVVELNSIRTRAAQRVATAREVELGKEAAAAHLTPAPTYVRHTSDTDWLGRVATVREGAAEIHQKAKMEASAWMRQVSALARADHEELRTQAVGYATVWGSQYGELATTARDSFLQTASHLAGVKLAADEEDDQDDADEAYDEAEDDSDGGNPFADDSDDSEDDEEDTKKESRRVLAWSIDDARKALDTGSYQTVDGMMLDTFSASALVQIYDALSPENQAKLAAMPLDKAMDIVWKLANKTGSRKTAARSLSEIAAEIENDWANVNFGARPYLDAMFELNSITDNYYQDSAKSIVAYFLSNASSWRGETAKRIKAELKAMMSGSTASKRTAGLDEVQRWCDRNGCVMRDFPDSLISEVAQSGDFERLNAWLEGNQAITDRPGWWGNDDPAEDDFYRFESSRHIAGNPHPVGTPAWFDWEDDPDAEGKGPRDSGAPGGGIPLRGPLTPEQEAWMNKGRKKAEWEGTQCSRCGGNNGGGSDRCAHCGAVMDPNPKRKATLRTAADTDISNFLVHQYPSKNPVYFTYQKDRGLYVHHYPLTHRGDQRLVLYSSGDSGIGQQIDEVRLPAGQAPDDAIRSMLGIGKAASRRTAEADGIDSPSPDSQNGYAESTLPNVEVATAPEDTNMGWIAEGDPNAVTASMGVFEAMFMRGATDQVTSGPLYDAAGKDASLGVGHVWTNTSCPAYRSYDPKDCTCKKTAARTAARDGWWPLVPDDRYPGENKLVCPDCGSADVSISGNNLGRDILRNNLYTSLTCNSCGRRDVLNDTKTSSRKHAEADGIDSPSPQSQNGYAESTLPNVEVASAPEDTNLGWISDGDANAEDESSFDAPDNPIANEAAYSPSGVDVSANGETYSNVTPEEIEQIHEHYRKTDPKARVTQVRGSINDHFAALVTAGKAYDKGMADGKIGDGIQYNPYPFDSSDGAEWIRGYRDAQGLQPGQKASSHKQAGDNDRPAGAAPMVDQVNDSAEDDVDMFGGEWVHEGSRRQALHPDDDPSQGPGYLDDAPDYLGDPPGMDPTSFGDFDMFAPEEPKQASRKQAMPAPADLGVSVGSIFYSSWGYDQTNVSFYEVVGLTPASVKIREVAKSYVEQNGPAGNKVIPQPGNYIGGEMTKRLQNSGFRDAAITINSSETAWLWDGKPQYETDSVYGH